MTLSPGPSFDAEEVPSNLFEVIAKGNFILASLPAPLPVEWLRKLGITHMPGQMSRSGLAVLPGSITTGVAFGIPPLLHHAEPQLQERFLLDLLVEQKRICIAITEPEWWITNGMMADYASMAVRTGGENSGGKGISLILVPLKDHPGVTRRRLKVAGQIVAGTSFIELDDVRVRPENLIGRENEGMKYIMYNFNHERMFISTLMEQPVVRHRLARCGAILEAQWSWVESFAYQLSKMPKETADQELGGLNALCKANAGIVLDECARCAVPLFGGNGYTRTGKGEIAEKIYREVPWARIPGGSEDVLLDLAIRQLTKQFRAQLAKETTQAKI
ncbi:long-chain specific acyl-CoA dehydrogenase [Fusarium oxysporum]|nr:long-chain specific acyl-CoA dehydrogenase [Fusarium oxysporum]